MGFWDRLRQFFQKSQPSAGDTKPATTPIEETKTAEPAPGPFTSITRQELIDSGKEARREPGWMLFGRSDIIPTIADARTLLIDRGMVQEKLITAEELAEIHQIGLEHDKYINREFAIQLSGRHSAEEAIAADRVERAAKKAKKKAEALERKRLRQQQIQERFLNDIWYLGKGVSGQLTDRQSNIEKLQQQQLPVLQTPQEMATAFGLTIPQLRGLCFHQSVAARSNYTWFEIPKKSGGERTLAKPLPRLARIQEWILQEILQKLVPHSAAHGFVVGRSILTNAQAHQGQKMVLNVDIQDFFPSIHYGRVRDAFRQLGYSGAVASILALLTTESPRKQVMYQGKRFYVSMARRGLPQGACTSPALSNWIAVSLDTRLKQSADKLGVTYTRYADDLTFSTPDSFEGRVGFLLKEITVILRIERFVLQAKKTRVQRGHERQQVTGLVVNTQPHVPRKLSRRIRAILHQAKFTGLEAQNREQRANFQAWLSGMIAYIQMVQPELGGKFRQQFNALI